ncbi:MAG: 6-phosphofructokinase [Clostridia bacterium]|nr:6-phosphofructokinase [Clostridia bacterium]
MERKFKKIGVLTSGGDAPGMNNAVRAVTRAAISNGVEVVGIQGGYYGLIHEKMIPLDARAVSGILNRGGTFLYSDRCLEFKTEEGMQKAVDTCHKYGLDGIVAIGGDGTFRGATDLSNRGIPTIGVPGSIDNDITATDDSIGFDTAMNTVVDAIDRLRDTCESHARCNVVEVMGRNCGDIAIRTAIACGAVGVALLECPFDEPALMEKIRRLKAGGKRSFIVVIAEGYPAEHPEFKSEEFAKRIQAETDVETKFVRLAHIVRGGSPTLNDRMLATEMGYAAVEQLLAGKSDLVICKKENEIVEYNINYALILDRMYKGKLKDGDLDHFSNSQIKEMREICEEKRIAYRKLYKMMDDISC